MKNSIKQVIDESVAASYAGTRDFPSHVSAVAEQGVESYRVDFRQHASTYFLSSGECHTVEIKAHHVPIADAFDGAAVAGAVRAIQQRQIGFPGFVERIMRAGCVGYVVWIAGRHVSYFGRRGEVHVEHFPPAPGARPVD